MIPLLWQEFFSWSKRFSDWLRKRISKENGKIEFCIHSNKDLLVSSGVDCNQENSLFHSRGTISWKQSLLTCIQISWPPFPSLKKKLNTECNGLHDISYRNQTSQKNPSGFLVFKRGLLLLLLLLLSEIKDWRVISKYSYSFISSSEQGIINSIQFNYKFQG